VEGIRKKRYFGKIIAQWRRDERQDEEGRHVEDEEKSCYFAIFCML
jgi:hypothetical protein